MAWLDLHDGLIDDIMDMVITKFLTTLVNTGSCATNSHSSVYSARSNKNAPS